MTLENFIESKCKKCQSAFFHKSEIKPLLLEFLNQLKEKNEAVRITIKELEK